MPGFHKLAGFVNFCAGVFRARSPWFLRIQQSKGHGVHSPFAFDLITNVIHSPHSFYAFSDIYETVSRNDINPESITAFNYLSFRLVHYLQSRDILEIHSGTGINTLFLTAPSSHIRCRCVEEDGDKVAVAECLQKQAGRTWETVTSFSDCAGSRYDAIFIDLDGCRIPDIRTLMELSHHDTFWVFHPIKKGTGKQFWDKIVHDERARATFGLKDTGIAFLKPDFHKKHYLV